MRTSGPRYSVYAVDRRTAEAATIRDLKWCDLTEIPNLEGTLYLASVEDLFSRRLLGFAMSEHPDAAPSDRQPRGRALPH